MRANVVATASLLLLAAPVAAQTIGDISARAQAGDANAEYLLGEAYRTGQGVTPDRDIAISWFRKAAAQGNVKAADMMGLLLFLKGERRESIALLQGAAARQDARALYLLGTAHFNGDGVAKDLPRAYAEMHAAANAGLPQAVRSLALMEPYITPQDRAAANSVTPGVGQSVAAAGAVPSLPRPYTPTFPRSVPATTQPPAAAATGFAATTAARPYAPGSAQAAPSPAPLRTPALGPASSTPPRPAPVVASGAALGPPAPAAMVPAPVAERAPDAAAMVPMRRVELPPSATPAPSSPSSVITPEPRAVSTPTVAAPRTTRPTPTPAPARMTGQWRVQLGALGSEAKAEDHWRALVRKVPSLAGQTHVSVAAGPIWRLQLTGLDRAGAQSQCQEIKAKGADCIVLAP